MVLLLQGAKLIRKHEIYRFRLKRRHSRRTLRHAFRRMYTCTGKLYSRDIKRKRCAWSGPDRYRKDGCLPAARSLYARRRRLSQGGHQLPHHVAHTRAGPTNRPSHAGLRLLCAQRVERGRVWRKRRKPIRPRAEEHAPGSRRHHSHARTSHLAPLARQRRLVEGELLHPRRSRPHARHGLLGGHHEDCLLPPTKLPNHHVLGHHAQGHREDGSSSP